MTKASLGFAKKQEFDEKYQTIIREKETIISEKEEANTATVANFT